MSSAKIRFVRCPKCLQILPELPNVPVYQCGGCNTFLQAKIRNQNASTSQLDQGDGSITQTAPTTASTLPETNASHITIGSTCSSHSAGEYTLDHDNCDSHKHTGVNSPNMDKNDGSNQNGHNQQLQEANSLKDRRSGGDPNRHHEFHDEMHTQGVEDVNNSGFDKIESVVCDDEQDVSDAQKSGGVTNEYGECDGEQEACDEQKSGTDRNEYGLFNGEHKMSDDQKSGGDRNEYGVFNDEQEMNDDLLSGGDGNESGLFNDELEVSDNQKSGSDRNESEKSNSEQEGGHNQRGGSDQSECGVFVMKQEVGGLNSSSEAFDGDCGRTELLAGDAEEPGISNGVLTSNALTYPGSGVQSPSPLAQTHSEVEVNDERLQLAAKVEAETDADHESDSAFRRISKGEPVQTEGSTSFATAHWLAGESISSDILESSHMELLHESARYRFDRVRSTDTFETTDFVNPSSELSGTLIDLSKSPTTRSSRAYYDDGVSSYEGTDDQMPERHKPSSKHAHRIAYNAASDGRLKRDRYPAFSDYGMQHHFENSESILPGKAQFFRKSSYLNRDELLEQTRADHRARNWRTDGDEYLSQHLLHQREPLAVYERGSRSSQLHNEFFHNSNYPSQNLSAYTEKEKMRLLRMVYELQEQLNSTSLNHNVNGGVAWEDDRSPMYYDRETLQQVSLHNLYEPRYSGRPREVSNWSRQKKFSRIPFSDEVATTRHQADCSMCSCPQNWQRSAQLPLLRHNKGFCHVHPRLNLLNSYGSCPSSPQRHLDSEFPMYSWGTWSDDQRHREHEMKKYAREKHHMAKRHLRPVAGGAPLITCPHCLKQLQLPADFLLFKKKFHRLKCGACSEVLKYSLVNRTHLIPYSPSAEAPPQSDVGECCDGTHRRNFTSTSHVSDCPGLDSDDFTDRDPVSRSTFDDAEGNAVEKNVSYSLQDDGREKIRSVMNDPRNKGKNPIEAYDSTGPSCRSYKSTVGSSEIKEVPGSSKAGGSPLHRLMGYSSPNAMMFGIGSSEAGTSSYHLGHGLK